MTNKNNLETDIRPADRLIMWLLSRVLDKHDDTEDQKIASLIQDSLDEGHLWAIDREYGFNWDHPVVSRETMNIVLDILDMWLVIEGSIAKLSAQDKAQLIANLKVGSSPQFLGFDANNESEFHSVAVMLIKRLGTYQHFAGHNLSSGAPQAEKYKSMLALYRAALQQTPHPVQLTLTQLVIILSF